MKSFIDPHVVASASTPRERQVLDLVRKRNLSIHRIHRDGTAIRISGVGVHITVVALGAVALADLLPSA